MKHLRNRKLFLTFLCCILSFVMLCSCTVPSPSDGIDDPDSEISQPNDNNNDNDNDDNNDDNNDDDDGDDGNDDGNNDVYDETRATDYAYRPQITEEMPIIRIDTADGSNNFATVPDRDMKLRDEIEYVDAAISVSDGADNVLKDVVAKVKARGNYTLNYEKKPLRIKFDKKQSMLGLNGGEKFKNWVLLADWKDLSMSNNTTALYLGKTILGSDGYYSTDYRNVEVYLNGQYWGVYLLVEQQEAKGENGRTSTPEVDDDYTGTDIGYLVEYDGYYTDEQNMPNGAGDPTFEVTYTTTTTGGNQGGGNWGGNQGGGNWGGISGLTHLDGGRVNSRNLQKGYTVKSDIYADAQLTFISSYMNNAFKIAYEAAYNNTLYQFNDDYSDIVSATGTVQEIVSAVIDVQSLVDTYILNEIACDADIAWSSFYISLDMTATGSKKLIFEAPWDFDSAFGIKKNTANSGTGMFAANCDNPWFLLLIHQDWFQQMIKDKWTELYKYGVLKTTLELVTEQKTVYKSYYEKNYERWQNRILYGNDELIDEINSYRTQGQAADYLYNWLYTRLNYLNEEWGNGQDVLAQTESGSDTSAFYSLTFYDIDLIDDFARAA